MRVIIGCEKSGVVREAFRALGHAAWSCDLEPADDGSPFHIRADVLETLRCNEWDIAILHPPCQHLAVSGARWFPEKRADGRQQAAIAFFMDCINAPVPRVCVENPVSIMSTIYRKPTQIIQPWMFGHGETKGTCLWLRGLPKLMPTNIVTGREQRVWKMGPSPTRSADRARTYPGVAAAFAAQWSNFPQNLI